MNRDSIPGRVHLVGIGGAHMSAIGRILLSWGVEVSGSDMRATPVTDAMIALGARVAIGPHATENVGDAGLVVTTSAATSDNPELLEAQRRGIPVIKRAEMVGRLMQGKVGVGIAGCHGKSTTSGLVAYILVQANRDPSYLIGADVADLGTNAAAGEGPDIVVEADEYDRAFLSYHPQVALVTNVEADHLDYYGTWEAVREAFAGFAANVAPGGTLALCASNAEAMRLRESAAEGVNIVTYGLDVDADWVASDVKTEGLGQSFTVSYRGESQGRLNIALPIQHNVENALGAIVVCRTLGLSLGEIAEALTTYRGVRRRFEPVGEADGVSIYDDYAHHPTEIADTAAAAKVHFPGRRIVALFQPHTYARTRYLLDGFKICFRDFDDLYILETYAAREAIADGMTGAQLAAELHDPEPGYFETFEAAAEGIAAVLKPGDVFFTVGAGDVDSVGPMVLKHLQARGLAMALDPAFVKALEGIAPVRLNEPLSRHTTIGIGGPADAYVAVGSASQLSAVLSICSEADVPVFTLGSGSNIVVGDGGIRGVVIENRAQAVTGPDADGDRFHFRLESGCSFAAEARKLAFAGYAGLEWACGIPGTLGGAVVYNAGAYGGCLGDVLQRIGVWGAADGETVIEASELGLVYRGSDFSRGVMARRAVLWAEVALWQGDTEALKERVADYDARRLKAQPRGRNAGSFFKNPPDQPAWRLLDAVGLRGYRVGGAEFSDKHCNFLINAGGATGADVAALKSLAQTRVREQFGIEMENEVSLVGEGW